MDWFLYYRKLRHERVKRLRTRTPKVLIKKISVQTFTESFFFYLDFLSKQSEITGQQGKGEELF